MPRCFGVSFKTSLTILVLAVCTAAPVQAGSLKGVVQSGQGWWKRSIANAQVTLLEATTGVPVIIGTATSDAKGNFKISTGKVSSSSIFYVKADSGDGAILMTVLGPKIPSKAHINELTTVAACYSMAQFLRTGEISGNAFGLNVAAGMNDNIVSIDNGESSKVLQKSPNADQTNSLRLTRSLGNVLSACLSYPLVRTTFFELTTPVGGTAPENTVVALANLARDPAMSVAPIYTMSKLAWSYSDDLFEMPDAWTVTVKVNNSGSNKNLFGGPAAIAFDSQGYAWIANNVVQGSTPSAKHVMVLKPNGEPADGSKGTPKSPLSGGGLLGVGLGVTIDPFGDAWFGNFGWGGVNPTPEDNGSVSRFSASGKPISPKKGYQGGPVRAQGMGSDEDGNIWIASYGNDSVFAFPGGDPTDAKGIELYEGSHPFGMAIAPDGSAWVTMGGGLTGMNQSSVGKFVLNDEGEVEQQFLTPVGEALKAITVDPQGNGWFCSQGDGKVYAYSPDGNQLGAYSGGGVFHPWGINIDGEGNIWVANFGPLALNSNFTDGRVSKLCGANPAGWPPGKTMGDPLSPDTGYTLPSAGDEVLLADGTPLYGKKSGLTSYAPLMRQTGLSIDQAGNVWTCNNWKPLFVEDVLANPGGDGIVIFVGLAPPVRSKL
ncbi:MAG TPA: hypothetical protein VM510_04175 [Caulifigura sp.]|nr:hypothetical protein [Caulifigura sp.]